MIETAKSEDARHHRHHTAPVDRRKFSTVSDLMPSEGDAWRGEHPLPKRPRADRTDDPSFALNPIICASAVCLYRPRVFDRDRRPTWSPWTRSIGSPIAQDLDLDRVADLLRCSRSASRYDSTSPPPAPRPAADRYRAGVATCSAEARRRRCDNRRDRSVCTPVRRARFGEQYPWQLRHRRHRPRAAPVSTMSRRYRRAPMAAGELHVDHEVDRIAPET